MVAQLIALLQSRNTLPLLEELCVVTVDFVIVLISTVSSSWILLFNNYYSQKRLHVCQAECLAPGAYGKIFWKQPFRGNRRDCFAIRDSIKISRPFPFAMNHEHFSSQLFIRYPSSILHIELGRISSHGYRGLRISCVGWSSGDVGGEWNTSAQF